VQAQKTHYTLCGYSSLSYLQKFPINKLKIDKSFVDGLPNNLNDLAIIAISHALKLTVIAEGVETSEQYVLLAKLNCNEIQVYFFSKPKPAEDVSQAFHQA
jgi:EAL domain-containing protein (putative c-di-GMP-specific phosphodiesterase class I)